MKKARSAAGIVRKGDKVFIALRIPGGDMGERWEFPGGKVEEGESFEETLVREYQEEFGVKVSVGRHIADAAFKHGEKDVQLSAYEVFFSDDVHDFILSEHTDVKWATFEEIKGLEFVDSDMLLYDAVVQFCRENDE